MLEIQNLQFVGFGYRYADTRNLGIDSGIESQRGIADAARYALSGRALPATPEIAYSKII
ncbi:MAG: hypothetical protein CMI01_18360 [Oceanospirillaceae bacterium]|nr:hypothetical protein [Oceanospirillaceae bacterium]